jgi:hypothetical protein
MIIIIVNNNNNNNNNNTEKTRGNKNKYTVPTTTPYIRNTQTLQNHVRGCPKGKCL